ncbi:hypothetical protein [Leifsonia sp. 2MCAF36]|uniref:hypothetical protein n=1 Tax=Leifsonia sp. 2MCAF36 TaxID=3232988 RepID=UPI003F94EDC9
MHWRSILAWVPASLFALLVAAGWSLAALDLGAPEVLLLGTVDGSQAGMLVLLLGVGCGIFTAVQTAILAGRLRRWPLRVLARVASCLVLVAALPVGYVLVFAAAITTVNEYRPLAVPEHSVVVQTFSWHHRSQHLLEGDGLMFHEVALCGDALPLDGYDAFSAGRYELFSRGGRAMLRFAQRPGVPLTGEAVLGSRPGDDVATICGSR